MSAHSQVVWTTASALSLTHSPTSHSRALSRSEWGAAGSCSSRTLAWSQWPSRLTKTTVYRERLGQRRRRPGSTSARPRARAVSGPRNLTESVWTRDLRAGAGLRRRRRSARRSASRPSTALPSSSITSASSVNVAASALASPALNALTNASSIAPDRRLVLGPAGAAGPGPAAAAGRRGGGRGPPAATAAAVARSSAGQGQGESHGVAYPWPDG